MASHYAIFRQVTSRVPSGSKDCKPAGQHDISYLKKFAAKKSAAAKCGRTRTDRQNYRK